MTYEPGFDPRYVGNHDRFESVASITDEEIEIGKSRTKYGLKPFHEHPDCIRMAYAWLDAQVPLLRKRSKSDDFRPMKHMIENWCGRYVSQTDVEVAATMHPMIKYRYCDGFNLGTHLILPSRQRLAGIESAFIHYYKIEHPEQYAYREVDGI